MPIPLLLIPSLLSHSFLGSPIIVWRAMVGTLKTLNSPVFDRNRYVLAQATSVAMSAFWRTTRQATAALIIMFTSPLHAEQPGDSQSPDEIEVIGVTPIGGAGLKRESLASNIQTATAEAISKQHALDLTEYLDRNLVGVFVNEAQSNPLQNDVQYRGFVASPLLGLPQGLAVYQDGVRLNEVFGETVNWALVPLRAIAKIELVPGSHPVFGLNSLGGALSIRTKTGFDNPGAELEVSGGSFGRFKVEAEKGNSFGENLAYYFTAAYLAENGWRDFSPSESTQLFSTISWMDERNRIDGSLTYVDTDLVGNGATPVQLLELDRSAIFTYPDQTRNELAMLNIRGESYLGRTKTLSWNAYYRRSRIGTVNGDDSDFEECEDAVNSGLVCSLSSNGFADVVAQDQAGSPIPALSSTLGATENTSYTDQDSFGTTVQLSVEKEVGDAGSNLFLVGAAVSIGNVEFFSATELGSLDAQRRALGSGYLVQSEFTKLDSVTTNYNAYVMNTFSSSDKTSFILSALYYQANVELLDRLGTALNGDHEYSRFNPSLGVTHKLSPRTQIYAGYSETSRIPSPVELTCADPDAPCRLPNAFLADPPLLQVTTHTYELGIRGRIKDTNWHAGYFNAVNHDDIIFISAGQTPSQGFFDNVGNTVRKGLEFSVSGLIADRGSWFLNYTYLSATFDENFEVASPNHPLASNGSIQVNRGDRLPGIPANLAKVGFDFSVSPHLTIGANAVYTSERFLRGDEGNLLPTVSGSVIVDLFGELVLNSKMLAFFKIGNLLGTNYETFGVLGQAEDVLGDEFDDNRFLAPGAPRAAWIGIRIGTNIRGKPD